MNREEVLLRLNDIFKDVFDDNTIMIRDETTAKEIEDWDSLEHINLILAVEQCFGIKFSMLEVTQIKNVGEMIDIICCKI